MIPKIPKWRETDFCERIRTQITDESPSTGNPYVASDVRWYGYSVPDLVDNGTSYSESVYLLLQGRLPTPQEASVFDALMVACCNPGPRHPAVRAGMTAAASTTEAVAILPLGLSVMSGNYLGAKEVEESARFLRDHQHLDPVALSVEQKQVPLPDRAAPGFGSLYAGIDEFTETLVTHLAPIIAPLNPLYFPWARNYALALKPEHGWLTPGFFAAIALDLQFPARLTGPLYQFCSAAGLLAHAAEAAQAGIHGQPWIDDQHYRIDDSHDPAQ